ncbi:hypothetical protein [Shewanella surugensis]|uniref:Uncharacterized protein n=1 Tax=Shewanella surugensis TaxID=212020 RepID=A0ABT0L6B6_9GAMM|nr:hypothetical protein [Shewanella surugensis]MCL1123221.1 hypothetical protein [Shewanella surugensis]
MMKAWILAGALVQNEIPPHTQVVNASIFDTQALTQEIETTLNEQMAQLVEDSQKTLLDIIPTTQTLASQPKSHHRHPISIQKKSK